MKWENESRKNLANNILAKRYEKGWSQEKLADRSNSSATYISDIEKGKRKPSIDFVDSIAKAFDISSWEMLKENKKISPKSRVDSKVENLSKKYI